jgi:hypothetical protein
MPGLKMRMTARGTVRNPDGTTKEIILKAERPLTEQEEIEHGNHTGIGNRDGGDQRGLQRNR